MIEIQKQMAERCLELLALPDDGIPRLLLDIGCGSGLSGSVLEENEHHWIGLDISPHMLGIFIIIIFFLNHLLNFENNPFSCCSRS